MRINLKGMKVLLVLLVFTCTVNAQRNIELMYVQNIGIETNHVISEAPITKKIENIEVSCSLIDPIKLDNLFNIENSNNGKFNYSYYSESSETFFKKRRWFNDKQKKKNNKYEILTDGLSALLSEKKITSHEYNLLLNQINNIYISKENTSIAPNDKNPFFINNKYLSVYKVKITNNSNNKATVNKSDFLLNSGDVNFELFSNDKLTQMHQLNNSLNNSIYEKINKFNMPEIVAIPPKSAVNYYFTSLPVLNESKLISLYYKNKSFVWDNDIETKNINTTKKYYAINVNPKIGNNNVLEVNHYYIVRNIKGKSYINDFKNSIYTNLNSKFEILAYCIYDNELFLSTIDVIDPNDYIDLEKKKRKKLYIKYSKYINE